MQRLALVLVLALVAVASACSSKSSAPTTPTTPAGPPLPKVTEAPLTSDSLLVFMKERFPGQIDDGTLILDFGSVGVDKEVITELSLLGITTTGQLNQIVPVDFDTKGFGAIKASPSPTSNVAGLMRDIMIIHDAKAYVTKAWRNGWVANGPEDFPAPAAYGVDLSILESGGVYDEGSYDEGEGEGDDEGYDPCAGDPCGD